MVSSSVRAEFDDVFLSKRTFRFNSLESMDAFISRSKFYQLVRLRSLEIGLAFCSSNSLEVCVDSLTRLPCGLRELHFRINPVLNGWFGVPGVKRGVNYGEVSQEELHLLDVLVKHAVQRLPKLESLSPVQRKSIR